MCARKPSSHAREQCPKTPHASGGARVPQDTYDRDLKTRKADQVEEEEARRQERRNELCAWKQSERQRSRPSTLGSNRCPTVNCPVSPKAALQGIALSSPKALLLLDCY